MKLFVSVSGKRKSIDEENCPVKKKHASGDENIHKGSSSDVDADDTWRNTPLPPDDDNRETEVVVDNGSGQDVLGIESKPYTGVKSRA